MSRVTCPVSCVTSYVSRFFLFLFLFFLFIYLFFFFFRTKWWSLLVEGLSSTRLPRLVYISLNFTLLYKFFWFQESLCVKWFSMTKSEFLLINVFYFNFIFFTVACITLLIKIFINNLNVFFNAKKHAFHSYNKTALLLLRIRIRIRVYAGFWGLFACYCI